MLLMGQHLGRLCPEMCLGREQELLSWSVNVTASTKPHACASTRHARWESQQCVFLRFFYSHSFNLCLLGKVAALVGRAQGAV